MKHNFNVGDGVKYGINGDLYPATVIRVTDSTVIVQDDNYRCTKPMSAWGADDAEYEYTPNPNGRTRKFTVKKNGSVTEVGTNYCFLSHERRYRQNPHV